MIAIFNMTSQQQDVKFSFLNLVPSTFFKTNTDLITTSAVLSGKTEEISVHISILLTALLIN
jgi:hypothetical protein